MRRLSLLIVGLLALSGCLSPAGYCQAVDSTTCQRLFECATGDARTALLSQYPDVASCTRALDERLGCERLTERTLCSGKRWNASKAAACVDEIQQTSCEALSTFRPACAPPCE